MAGRYLVKLLEPAVGREANGFIIRSVHRYHELPEFLEGKILKGKKKRKYRLLAKVEDCGYYIPLEME